VPLLVLACAGGQFKLLVLLQSLTMRMSLWRSIMSYSRLRPCDAASGWCCQEDEGQGRAHAGSARC
jgi:hypothetical protein